LVAKGVRLIVDTEKSIGGQLGRPSGARFRTYERLKSFADDMKGTLFETGEHGVQLKKAIEDIHRAPLLQSATDLLNRQLKSGISDHDLADLVVGLRQDARLCRLSDEEETSEPQVICSMGLRNSTSGAQPRIELATFTLVFEKSNDTKFTPAERQQCAEEGRKAVLRMLQGLNDDATIKIELVEIGSGSGSYWQEYAAYIVGFVGLAGGVGNAIHIIAEGLIQTGNLTAALAESMKSSGAWLKRTAWRFNAQNVSPELSVRQPYCFGIREYLDRRTKRCRDCTFRNDCVAAIEGS
jgi:hypothetical protein